MNPDEVFEVTFVHHEGKRKYFVLANCNRPGEALGKAYVEHTRSNPELNYPSEMTVILTNGKII